MMSFALMAPLLLLLLVLSSLLISFLGSSILACLVGGSCRLANDRFAGTVVGSSLSSSCFTCYR